jgi:hypothetical protein
MRDPARPTADSYASWLDQRPTDPRPDSPETPAAQRFSFSKPPHNYSYVRGIGAARGVMLRSSRAPRRSYARIVCSSVAGLWISLCHSATGVRSLSGSPHSRQRNRPYPSPAAPNRMPVPRPAEIAPGRNIFVSWFQRWRELVFGLERLRGQEHERGSQDHSHQQARQHRAEQHGSSPGKEHRPR